MTEAYLNHLLKRYPGLAGRDRKMLEGLISQNLLSSFTLKLPTAIKGQAEKIIATLFKITHSSQYLDFYRTQLQERDLVSPGNHAIMMSYDFHVDHDGNLKLIEVNTNAAFLILGYELYLSQGLSPTVPSFSMDSLKDCILNELALNRKSHKGFKSHETFAASAAAPKIAIIDENPSQQRLFLEFLVAEELFKLFGFEAAILDTQDPKLNDFNFVYNRDTDFYLEKDRTRRLKELYNRGQVCLSPNPYEYFLLADKERMVDWNREILLAALELSHDEREILKKHIPYCFDFSEKSSDEIWSLRKGLFFKPKRAFGSKQTYKAGSISRKTFDSLDRNEFLAQEYISAPEVHLSIPHGEEQSFKYDLRCYAYQGELQLILARLYQGQVTNLKTPHGGFACVQFFTNFS